MEKFAENCSKRWKMGIMQAFLWDSRYIAIWRSRNSVLLGYFAANESFWYTFEQNLAALEWPYRVKKKKRADSSKSIKRISTRFNLTFHRMQLRVTNWTRTPG